MESLDAFARRVENAVDALAASPVGRALLEPIDRGVDAEALLELLRALSAGGLSGITVPAQFGGAGLSPDHERIVEDALDRAGLNTQGLVVHLRMCIPTLLQWCNDDQCRRLIPPMLEGDELWCQLFSEPDAGSDLASLKTQAARTEQGWLLNGQKVWTSLADRAAFGLCLARTDPTSAKHRGLSAFAVDLTLPGVTVQPIRQITGYRDFNEVFFDQVTLPPEALIGECGRGWDVAMTMLMQERHTLGESRRMVEGKTAAITLAAAANGELAEPLVRQQIAELYCGERVLLLLLDRIRLTLLESENPGPEGSLGKLGLSIFLHRCAKVSSRLVGPQCIAWSTPREPQTADDLLEAFAMSIAGGTSEIQRNIIAERLLGLPREPDPNRSGLSQPAAHRG